MRTEGVLRGWFFRLLDRIWRMLVSFSVVLAIGIVCLDFTLWARIFFITV